MLLDWQPPVGFLAIRCKRCERLMSKEQLSSHGSCKCNYREMVASISVSLLDRIKIRYFNFEPALMHDTGKGKATDDSNIRRM